jgi:hypothetical protein
MASSKNRIPKKGDKVSAHGHEGAFVVYDVDHRHQVVEIKQIGKELAFGSIRWGALTFLDELDESQNALRVVREATED